MPRGRSIRANPFLTITNSKAEDMGNSKKYGELIAQAEQVDTTIGLNGYPSRLRVAYTADTMGELRELWEAATEAGHRAEAITLHRRDGWALWERTGSADLQDEAYMGQSDDECTVTIRNTNNREEEAYDLVCGTRYELEDVADLFTKTDAVKALSAELPDPDELEEGEKVKVFIDTNNWSIDYTIQTGQNGYAHDTHHYRTALLIKEREEENEWTNTNTITLMKDWKPVKSGKTYCSPGCGAGCTFEEFSIACMHAKQLADRMGPGWHIHVFENLGWHYNVVNGRVSLHEFLSKDGKVTKYWLNAQAIHNGLHFKGESPEALIKKTLEQVVEKIEQLEKGFTELTVIAEQIPKQDETAAKT